mgnify:CR=1 FL=1
MTNLDTFCALKEIKNTSNETRLPMKFDILNALKGVYKHFRGEKLRLKIVSFYKLLRRKNPA